MSEIEPSREANTNLITARAAQHTLNITVVYEQADHTLTIATEVKADVEAALAESFFRRQAMVVAVAAIGLVMMALYALKRELSRQLQAGSQTPQPHRPDTGLSQT